MPGTASPDTIGIRELKTHLSRHLKRVRAGTRLVITDRGRSIATISAVETTPDTAWTSTLIADGDARWSGGKPRGVSNPVKSSGGSASSVVLEDRG
jgi:prevent-host-death family protein